MGELANVVEIDKRKIKNKGNILSKIQELFREKTQTLGEKII